MLFLLLFVHLKNAGGRGEVDITEGLFGNGFYIK